MTKDRNGSLDLLKLLAMWFITTAHFMGWGGAVNTLTPEDFNYWWVMPLYFVSQAGNTLFFMISGYFVHSVKIEKAVFLERKTASYSILLTVISCGLWGGTVLGIIKSCFPIVFNFYWFLSVYLILYLFAYLLIPATEKTSKSHLLIVLFALIFNNCFLIDEARYTLLEGIPAFLAGCYFRRFTPFRQLKRRHMALLYLFSVVLYAAERVVVRWAGWEHRQLDETLRYLLVFLSATLLFGTFEKLDIRSKAASFLAPNVVAVYLITAHPMIRNQLYQDVLPIGSLCRSPAFLPFYLGVNLLLLVLCSLVDKPISRLNRIEAGFWTTALSKLYCTFMGNNTTSQLQ